MKHDYNTRGNKDAATFKDALKALKITRKKSISNLQDDISNTKDVIIQRLQESNLKLKERVNCLEDKVVQLEIKHGSLQQYGRRSNLQIEEITTSISDDELKKTAVGILKSINVNFDSSDV